MKVLTATAVQLRNRYFILFCELLFLLTSCEQSYLKESRVQVGLRAANVQAKIRAVAMGLPSSSAAAAAAVDAVSGQLPLPTRAEVEIWELELGASGLLLPAFMFCCRLRVVGILLQVYWF